MVYYFSTSSAGHLHSHGGCTLFATLSLFYDLSSNDYSANPKIPVRVEESNEKHHGRDRGLKLWSIELCIKDVNVYNWTSEWRNDKYVTLKMLKKTLQFVNRYSENLGRSCLERVLCINILSAFLSPVQSKHLKYVNDSRLLGGTFSKNDSMAVGCFYRFKNGVSPKRTDKNIHRVLVKQKRNDTKSDYR